MQHTRPLVILVALILGACGSVQQAAQPASTPAAATLATSATNAPAPTTIPTPDLKPSPTAQPSSVPTNQPTAAATTVPNPAANATATAPLILDPTAIPTAPPATSAPAQPTALPVPAGGSAPAAPAAPPARAVGGGPVRLVIKDIGIDYKPVSVGLDKNRVPIVPKHDVGWYNLSAGPGQGENIVLWGHVLRFRSAPKIPAPFGRLKELKPGARVVLYDKAGNAHDYKVTKQVWVTPDQVEYILPQGKEQVTMVSCIGDKIITNGEVVDESHRLITVAEPEG